MMLRGSASKAKGSLLYQMPKGIYLDNRWEGFSYMIGSLIGISMIVVLIIICAWLSRYRGFLMIMLILIFLLIYLVSLLPREMGTRPLYRFRIYENGFIPCTKPFECIYRDKEYFIPFKNIEYIRYFAAGGGCEIKLKGKGGSKKKKKQNEVVIYPYNDIGGYLKLAIILRKKFPEEKYPNLKVIWDEFRANRARQNKRITKKQYKEVLERLKHVNKEFL